MNTRYSPETGSFYPHDIDYKELPADLIEVTGEAYDIAMSRPAGHSFAVNRDGTVTVTPPAPELKADTLARALADIRRERAPILASLDGIAGRAARAGNATVAEAADAAIVALLDITKLPALLNAKSYEAMKAAVLARYREIAAAAPAAVKTAFAS